jgi:hypothetical protein
MRAFSGPVREGKMTKHGLREAGVPLVVQRHAWSEVLPSERVRELAESLPEQQGLRALDFFQLAAALVWCREKPRGRLFVCADARLAEVATKIGFNLLP